MSPAKKSAGRSYRQYCSLARALDVVGERWTLLMIRELMIGPRRYRELLANLPTMGTNLLATRLKELEGHGVIERIAVKGEGRGRAYRLTPHGRGLEPVIRALIQWGVGLLGAPRDGELSREEWDLVAFRMLFRPERSDQVEGFFVLHADELELVVHVENRQISLLEALPSGAVAIVVEGSGQLLRSLVLGEADPDAVMAKNELKIKGSRRQVRRFFFCFQDPNKALKSTGEAP